MERTSARVYRGWVVDGGRYTHALIYTSYTQMDTYKYIHMDAYAYAITRGGPCTVGNSRHDLGPRELRRRPLAHAEGERERESKC